ncbi:hypothetical protein JCM11491_000641 [Sporobolomyces phaffii]
MCHVVPISSILLKETSLPPYTFPPTPSPSLTNVSTTTTDKDGSSTHRRGGGGGGHQRVELPSCPICLEKLDTKVTGLVQIQCKHNYHCNCLLRWGDSRCPVCRATNLKPRTTGRDGGGGGENSGEDPPSCAVCTSPSNLWICIICGNVGCGRYQGGHAHSHFSDTGHTFSLELGTGRIWSYTDDEYVHRLLRVASSTIGSGGATRLIELPSLASHAPPAHPSSDDDISSKIASSYGRGPDRSAEEEQDKLESIALEYSGLLQSNLEQQREWFEDELARAHDRCAASEARRDALAADLARVRDAHADEDRARRERDGDRARVLAALQGQVDALERDARRSEDERRKERHDAAKVRKQLERDVADERAVAASLAENLAAVRGEIDARRRETDLVRAEVDDLKDQLNDLMAALTMRDRIEREPEGSELRGGTVGVVAGPNSGTDAQPTPSQILAGKRKKKNKKK